MGVRRLVLEKVALSLPAIAVHGGAGTWKMLEEGGEELRARARSGLGDALEAGWAVLADGGDAVLAAVEAVSSMEDSGLFNAGRGSAPTTAGDLEADASVMDGTTGRFGGVCAATWPANPIRAALAVARLDGDPPPVLLAGAGADEVARAAGLSRMPSRQSPSAPLGPTAMSAGGPEQAGPEQAGPEQAGTVGAVAIDVSGHLAAATSTGGLAGQRPGRVGDSPIAGAGTWADETVAVSGTGTGEAFVLAGFAHLVAWSLGRDRGLEASVTEALAAVVERGGTGGALVLTLAGELCMAFTTPAMARGWCSGAGLSVSL